MEIPRYSARELGGGHPSIYGDPQNRSDRFRHAGRQHGYSSKFSPTLASIPMSIPDNRQQLEDDLAPPPLPPPRFVPVDGPQPHGYPEGMSRHSRDVSSGSWRTDGSFGRSPVQSLEFDRPDYKRRTSDRTIKPDRDEGYHSFDTTVSTPQDSLPKLFMSHDQFQFRPTSGNDYDSSLLKKFDARRTLDNRSPPRRSALSMSANEVAHRGPTLSLLTPLSLPIRSSNRHFIESPGHYTETPLQVTASPRQTPLFSVSSNDYRSPIETVDPERSPPFRSRRTNSDDATVSTQGSYENSADDVDFPMEETSAIKKLYIGDGPATIGQKRRASSPPGDDAPLHTLSGTSDIVRRREGLSRASPTPRLSVIPQGSVSSVSSAGRSASYISNSSLMTSGATSINSFERRSPNGLSPGGGLSPVDGPCGSPFSTTMSLAHTPHLARVPQHVVAENVMASPRKLTEVPKSTISRIQGFFMCECCPKKPKKFSTAEELSVHEAEKQYECSFCGNRFKNKNEAERHQNSLHVRRHSWSCSALHGAGFDKAFQESTTRPGEVDFCGYCGEEFSRSGGSGRARQATEQDWDDRHRHLQEVHKYRECNSGKKFYRADHFRQHLKHSHAGTGGKWTNMLETACMIEEEPPQPR